MLTVLRADGLVVNPCSLSSSRRLRLFEATIGNSHQSLMRGFYQNSLNGLSFYILFFSMSTEIYGYCVIKVKFFSLCHISGAYSFADGQLSKYRIEYQQRHVRSDLTSTVLVSKDVATEVLVPISFQ